MINKIDKMFNKGKIADKKEEFIKKFYNTPRNEKASLIRHWINEVNDEVNLCAIEDVDVCSPENINIICAYINKLKGDDSNWKALKKNKKISKKVKKIEDKLDNYFLNRVLIPNLKRNYNHTHYYNDGFIRPDGTTQQETELPTQSNFRNDDDIQPQLALKEPLQQSSHQGNQGTSSLIASQLSKANNGNARLDDDQLVLNDSFAYPVQRTTAPTDGNSVSNNPATTWSRSGTANNQSNDENHNENNLLNTLLGLD